jgi:hypothetical protein
MDSDNKSAAPKHIDNQQGAKNLQTQDAPPDSGSSYSAKSEQEDKAPVNRWFAVCASLINAHQRSAVS